MGAPESPPTRPAHRWSPGSLLVIAAGATAAVLLMTSGQVILAASVVVVTYLFSGPLRTSLDDGERRR